MTGKFLMAAALAAGSLLAASAANANVILSFGQVGNTNTITATNTGGTSTTITGSAIPIMITQIFAGATPPVAADLSLSATSTGAATSSAGSITQHYSGNFSITSGATNYLSGTFTDAVFGSGTSLTLQAASGTAGETVSFTSSVIPAADLAQPDAIALGFANVTPAATISGTSLASFTSSVSGTFSATTAAVPEPASLTLLGTALLGLGLIGLRRSKRV